MYVSLWHQLNLAESQYHELAKSNKSTHKPCFEQLHFTLGLRILQISSNPRLIRPSFGQPGCEGWNVGIRGKIFKYIA